MGESFNEMPIMTHDTCKRTDVSVGLRRQTSNNGGNILLRRFDSILAHMVSQINELRSK